jgi:non-specific serine/threonine protein kinase
VIIFDEAQAIKNIYADTTGAVRQLKAYFKLAMTGTPVENHIGEYYSIVDLAYQDCLGLEDFKPLIRQRSHRSST